MAKRIIDQVIKTAALPELRKGTPQQDVAKTYGIAPSTISRWKQAAGIEAGTPAGAAIRSKPLRVDDDSSEASSADRRKMIDKMISLVTDLAEDGGLRSHDVKNLSLASKALNEASSRLEQEEQAREVVQQHSPSVPRSKGSDLDTLIEIDARGAPRNLECHFSILDVGDARERFGEEEQERAWERMVEIFRRYGHEVDEDTYQYMISKLNNDFEEETARKERNLERLRRRKLLVSPEDYNGEGRS